MKKNKDYTISSGNIFEDLGLSQPEERLTKAELARQINNIIQQNGFTQFAAAKLLQTTQPKISDLSKGRLSGFSLERLFRFLNILGQDVIIKITPKIQAKERAEIKVNIPKQRKPTLKNPITDPSKAQVIHASRKNKI